MVNYQQKCDRCSEFFRPTHARLTTCPGCKKKENKLQVNNPRGNNKHTPKAELIGKREHAYKTMSRNEQEAELKRLFDARSYHKTMTLKYAHKASFLMECMGLQLHKNEGVERAEKDFMEKEGVL